MKKPVVYILAALVLATPFVAASCGKKPSVRVRQRSERGHFYRLFEKDLRRLFEFDIVCPEAPEITEVTITSSNYVDQAAVFAYPTYNIDIYNSQFAGRVGAPVQISYPDMLEDVTITLTYDEDELRWVDETSLYVIVDNSDIIYNSIPCVLDPDANTITFAGAGPGTYLMIEGAGGSGSSSHVFDNPEYTSDWERNNDTGDIMTIADTSWALAVPGVMIDEPVFEVYTPEQLAGATWYINTHECDVDLQLMADIDLSGYEWAPLCTGSVDQPNVRLTIHGNGHTISNLHIVNNDAYHVAFIGHNGHLEIYDLTLENAYVEGGFVTAIVVSEVAGTPVYSNVHVSGEVVSSAPDSNVGAFSGWDSHIADYSTCTIDVTVNGEHAEYFSPVQETVENADITEFYTLTCNEEGLITRDSPQGAPERIAWVIYRNGEVVLQRNAENEHAYSPFAIYSKIPGDTYVVYLEYHNGEAYVRCSNFIEFTVEEGETLSFTRGGPA